MEFLKIFELSTGRQKKAEIENEKWNKQQTNNK